MNKNSTNKRVVAFIPARSGSKRIPDKNIKVLQNHPLMAYTIAAAKASGVFSDIICVTDSAHYAAIASHYGAVVPALRPASTASDTSADIEWVTWALDLLAQNSQTFDALSILRPTSPFRQAHTISQAWNAFSTDGNADSLRAVSLCSEHPGKMWVLDESRMTPLLPNKIGNVPWHSNQYAALPKIYVQNASLEIAWVSVIKSIGTISGESVMPYISTGMEGFDINSPEDWLIAENYLAQGLVSLPQINSASF
jgi:CMP-N,N'-diacetyllegionaminic acid synthase